jgi:hypothetical protein
MEVVTPKLLRCCSCRYIRYIYNRIILENATVRAAAVSALANFGAKVRSGVQTADSLAVRHYAGVITEPVDQRARHCRWQFIL